RQPPFGPGPAMWKIPPTGLREPRRRRIRSYVSREPFLLSTNTATATSPPLVSHEHARTGPVGPHRPDPPTRDGDEWSVLTTRRLRHTSSCWNAKAAAAVRDVTPSLAKMFCRWRATVCSLTTSVDAIARFVFPAATRRSTSSSRGLRPCASAGELP